MENRKVKPVMETELQIFHNIGVSSESGISGYLCWEALVPKIDCFSITLLRNGGENLICQDHKNRGNK